VVRSASSRAHEASQPRRPRPLGAVLATHDAPRLFRLGLTFDVAATPPPDHQQCRQAADQHQRSRDGAAGAHYHRAASCTIITITIPSFTCQQFFFFPTF